MFEVQEAAQVDLKNTNLPYRAPRSEYRNNIWREKKEYFKNDHVCVPTLLKRYYKIENEQFVLRRQATLCFEID